MSVTPKTPAQKKVEPASGRAKAGDKQKNVDIVRSAYEEFSRGNIPAVLDALAPTIEWLEPSGPLPPPAGSGTHRGRAAVEKEIFGSIPKTWTEFRVEPDTYLDAGDRVVVTGHFRYRAKATGAAVQAPCAQVWTIRDGKAIRMQNYTDTARLAQALGK